MKQDKKCNKIVQDVANVDRKQCRAEYHISIHAVHTKENNWIK